MLLWASWPAYARLRLVRSEFFTPYLNAFKRAGRADGGNIITVPGPYYLHYYSLLYIKVPPL